jgi:hypothetical protein
MEGESKVSTPISSMLSPSAVRAAVINGFSPAPQCNQQYLFRTRGGVDVFRHVASESAEKEASITETPAAWLSQSAAEKSFSPSGVFKSATDEHAVEEPNTTAPLTPNAVNAEHVDTQGDVEDCPAALGQNSSSRPTRRQINRDLFQETPPHQATYIAATSPSVSMAQKIVPSFEIGMSPLFSRVEGPGTPTFVDELPRQVGGFFHNFLAQMRTDPLVIAAQKKTEEFTSARRLQESKAEALKSGTGGKKKGIKKGVSWNTDLLASNPSYDEPTVAHASHGHGVAANPPFNWRKRYGALHAASATSEPPSLEKTCDTKVAEAAAPATAQRSAVAPNRIIALRFGGRVPSATAAPKKTQPQPSSAASTVPVAATSSAVAVEKPRVSVTSATMLPVTVPSKASSFPDSFAAKPVASSSLSVSHDASGEMEACLQCFGEDRRRGSFRRTHAKDLDCAGDCGTLLVSSEAGARRGLPYIHCTHCQAAFCLRQGQSITSSLQGCAEMHPLLSAAAVALRRDALPGSEQRNLPALCQSCAITLSTSGDFDLMHAISLVSGRLSRLSQHDDDGNLMDRLDMDDDGARSIALAADEEAGMHGQAEADDGEGLDADTYGDVFLNDSRSMCEGSVRPY